jgi:protein-disulfide isomerase
MKIRSVLNGIKVCVCLLVMLTRASHADMRPAQDARNHTVASPEKIVQYVRDRFQVPDAVSVTAEPVRQSQFGVLVQTTVTINDGKKKRANEAFLTKDGRCFVMGNVFALHEGSTAEIMRCIREAAKLSAKTELRIGAFEKTPYPQFLRAIITASDGKSTQSAEVFITKDRQTGILGLVLPFREDFVQSLIKTKDVPSQGPSKAPVTIVEYADLQCPTCARLHEFIEKQILPKYGDKVRVVFKEFLIPGHDWSPMAAVANECAYQINPKSFTAYRCLIFSSQNAINASNARELLLGFAADAGVDRSTLEACLDPRLSLAQVDASREEGKNLGVHATPTSFINGRMIIGLPSEVAYFKAVDDALRIAANRPEAKSATL